MNWLDWHLAEAAGEVTVEGELVPGIRKGRINKNFYSSLSRARLELCSKGELRRERRKLLGLEELKHVYPFKTQRLEVRDLRQRLLPHLVELAGQHRVVSSSAAREEEVLLKSLSEDPQRAQAFAVAWEPAYEAIVGCLPMLTSPSEREVLLRLLLKGILYFDARAPSWIGSKTAGRRGGTTDSASFASLARDASHVLSGQVIELLRVLYHDAIPLDARKQRLPKDQLFRVADFYRDKFGLKDETAKELLRREPDLISALPGHTPARAARGMMWRSSPVQFSDYTKKILDRHALGWFQFVSIA